MELFKPGEVLIKIADGTQWEFLFYKDQEVMRAPADLIVNPITSVIKPKGEDVDDNIEEYPSDGLKRA